MPARRVPVQRRRPRSWPACSKKRRRECPTHHVGHDRGAVVRSRTDEVDRAVALHRRRDPSCCSSPVPGWRNFWWDPSSRSRSPRSDRPGVRRPGAEIDSSQNWTMSQKSATGAITRPGSHQICIGLPVPDEFLALSLRLFEAIQVLPEQFVGDGECSIGLKSAVAVAKPSM